MFVHYRDHMYNISWQDPKTVPVARIGKPVDIDRFGGKYTIHKKRKI